MNSQEENDRALRFQPQGSLESPFLKEALFVTEAEGDGEGRLAALEAESLFQRAFEQPWALTGAVEAEREEAFEEEVIGKDERTLVTDTLKTPNRWVCAIDILIDNPKWGTSTSEPQFISKSRATGILIGPRYVLTAGHILDKQTIEVDGKKKSVNVKMLTVSPARNESNSNNPFGKVKSKAVRVSQRYRIRRKVRQGSKIIEISVLHEDDYALIILEKDLASSTHAKMTGVLGYWGHNPTVAVVRQLEPDNIKGKEIVVIGYPGDTCGKDKFSGSKPEKESKIANCQKFGNNEWASTQWRSVGTLQSGLVVPYVEEDPTLVFHTADTYEGQSGAPICRSVDQKLHLVGIHTNSDNPQRNRGARVTRRMLGELCAWINADAGYPLATIKDDTLVVQPKNITGASVNEFFDGFVEDESQAEDFLHTLDSLSESSLDNEQEWEQSELEDWGYTLESAEQWESQEPYEAEFFEDIDPKPPQWLKRVLPTLNKYRGDIPLEFLLGWIAKESGGQLGRVTIPLDERGYFQIHPQESETLKLDHKRLSTDSTYSLLCGIKLVNYYSRIVAGAKFGIPRGTNLHCRFIKLLHTGIGFADVILKSVRESGLKPDTWQEVKDHVQSNRESIQKRFKKELGRGDNPIRFINNVDETFTLGQGLISFELETFEGFDDAEFGDDEFEDNAEASYRDIDPELAEEAEHPHDETEDDMPPVAESLRELFAQEAGDFTSANDGEDELELLFEQPLEERDNPEGGTSMAHMAFDHILLESVDQVTSARVLGVVTATPSALTTPFYNAGVVGTTPDATLQQALTTLINSKPAYRNAAKNLAISLVDLSGPNKFSPKYAGSNDLANFYGASVNKITGLLGVYQLVAEANELLKAKPAIADSAGLESELKSRWSNAGIPAKHHPLVAMILAVQPGPPATATIRPELVARLNAISKGNQNGSTPIVLLKFLFIGSTMLAHGLFSPANQGGLWTRRAYGDVSFLGKRLSLSDWPTKENPHPKTLVHNINAVSVAQFYTLAAQGRMIDHATSKAVLGHLTGRGSCTTSAIDVSALSGKGQISAKCGIFGGWVHDTVHFKETATLREFVVIILTKNSNFGIMKGLFNDLIKLVP